jgi:hypothetical protein
LQQPPEEPASPERGGEEQDHRTQAMLPRDAIPGSPEAALGPVDQGLGLRRRNAQGLADLLVRPALELSEHQRVTVVLGDQVQDLVDPLAFEEPLYLLEGVVGGLVEHFV